MTCRDCIHFKGVCDGHGLYFEDEYIKNVAFSEDVKDLCPDFKNKADFVEVVRCKDCRFNVANITKDNFDETDYSGADIVCSYHLSDGHNEDDFCSYGERKDTECPEK